MKVVFYFVSWLATLLTGLIVGVTILNDMTMALAVTGVAALLSAPFILIFCVTMYFYLNKNPSKFELHTRTFLFHLVGSVITVGILTLIFGNDIPWELYLMVFGYFAVDTMLFHAFVHIKHTPIDLMAMSEDILDAPTKP